MSVHQSQQLLNEDESVMINEDLIQAKEQIYRCVNYIEASNIDDELDSDLDISYDEHLGYLTTCPTIYRHWNARKCHATFTRTFYYEENESYRSNN